jgi:hypothetical protein
MTVYRGELGRGVEVIAPEPRSIIAAGDDPADGRAMTRLTDEELIAKYPTTSHGPWPECPRCKGEGEVYIKLTSGPYTGPCMCLFVDHDMMPLAHECMNATVKQMRVEFGQ